MPPWSVTSEKWRRQYRNLSMNEMNLEGASVRRSFNRAAESYDGAATLQRQVADTLIADISIEPAAIVDAGCGTGYGIATLARRFPGAHLLALDLAPAMLHATRQRLSPLAALCTNLEALPLRTA